MRMLRPDTIALTAVLALLVAFGPVATDMYVPSMPEIGRLLDASTAEVQLTLSSYLIGFAIGQSFYGPISDRYGRKPVLLIALLIFCGASAACAGAPSIEWLIVARILQALGGSGTIVLARAIVRDLYAAERAGRELSRMGAIMSIAPVLAPLLGSLVQVTFGWRANFLAVLGVGLIATAIVRLFLPETLNLTSSAPLSASAFLHDYRTLLKNRSLLVYVGIVSTSYAGLFAWISASPFVLQNLYGLSPLEFGLAFGLACIGSVIGAGTAASLVTRIGLDRTNGARRRGLGIGCRHRARIIVGSRPRARDGGLSRRPWACDAAGDRRRAHAVSRSRRSSLFAGWFRAAELGRAGGGCGGPCARSHCLAACRRGRSDGCNVLCAVGRLHLC